ncbi:MAG: WD40/YVTN/BNR-like repeat-containing protein, partial [Bacteroidota bacterium]
MRMWYIPVLFLVAGCLERSPEHQERERYDGPMAFEQFHRDIRTPDGAQRPGYRSGYLMRELRKAQARGAQSSRTTSSFIIDWRERGPANVPGRTRGLIVDPNDPQGLTWFAGSAAGGVWKTANGGINWELLTPDLPNLATTVLAVAPSRHEIIYLGTGEGFGNLDRVRGSGIFKSTDRGLTWNWLTATAGFGDVNRLVVSPTDANVAVAATNSGIYRTTDGGASWLKTSSRPYIEDLVATPGDFRVQYAGQNSVGILKSTDGGITWNLTGTGLNLTGRAEIDVSPVNTAMVYVSAEGNGSGTGSDLYRSSDAGLTWKLVDVRFNTIPVGFLSSQGWYDNAIACDPFRQDVVYVGGVNLFRIEVKQETSTGTSWAMEQDKTDTFMELINFTNATNGNFDVGASAEGNTVELRFGEGRKQLAHRFLVPEGATSGVPDGNYTYAGYTEVPFEVWDLTRNKQLMVSFRDQDRNGEFNLLPSNMMGTALQQSREYVFIHNADYNATDPNPSVAVPGGMRFRNMFFFWPVLAPASSWPNGIVTSALRFALRERTTLLSAAQVATDAYNGFSGINRFITFGSDVHPDQHNITMIPTGQGTFRILMANDGGLFLSNSSTSPGIAEGNWTMRGLGYRTSQFYGADKKPGQEAFFGGLQDNGTWRSPDEITAAPDTRYVFQFGGDGFEVIWNQSDPLKLIGGSQGNVLRKSVDGGATWQFATSGLTGNHPFVSKVAGSSAANPDRIFTLSSSGVFRSDNFGSSWTLTPIADKWGGSGSMMDVDVSLADDRIVWAGLGMSELNDRTLHVSTDAGLSFKPVSNYTGSAMGNITKLATHPTQPSTAYALFSFAGKPKVLRTTDLGVTWEDLSGYSNGSVSTNGFPDVAVYCLYVHRNNTNILWAGTEIGIVESTDNGNNWYLVDDFPNVSVWDLKARDNAIVIATHGRGIWTAAFERYPQTVSFSAPTGLNQSTGTFQLSATASSGLPVTFTTTDTDKLRIDGNQVTILKPGKASIVAQQTGTSVYLPSAQVSKQFCIGPVPPVITPS